MTSSCLQLFLVKLRWAWMQASQQRPQNFLSFSVAPSFWSTRFGAAVKCSLRPSDKSSNWTEISEIVYLPFLRLFCQSWMRVHIRLGFVRSHVHDHFYSVSVLTNDVKSGSPLLIIVRIWIKLSKDSQTGKLFKSLFKPLQPFSRWCLFQWINACDVFKENCTL